MGLFALGSIPYLVAWHAGGHAVFTGVLGNWRDTKQHLAFIEHFQHHWMLPNVLETEAQRPFLLNSWFGLGGGIARMIGPIAAWHVLRLIALCVFAVATQLAVARFAAPGRRALATVLAVAPPTLALLPGVGVFADPSSQDGNTICYAFDQPQLALSAGLVILAVLAIDDFHRGRGQGVPWGAALSTFALWFLHPFEPWSVGCVLAGVIIVLRWRLELGSDALVRAAIAMAVMVAPVIAFLGIDAWSGGQLRTLQHVHGDAWPLPWDLVLNLGVTCAFALPVALGRWRSDGDRDRTEMLALWLAATWIGLYLPGAPWRWHQVNGLQVCVALLAVRARPLARWIVGRERAACVAAIAAALTLQAPYLRALFAQATSSAPPFFIDRDIDAALAWLHAHAPDGSRVLSRPELGLDVAARTFARPYFGSVRKTEHWEAKRERATAFFERALPDVDAAALVADTPIDFVICTVPRDAACTDEYMAALRLAPAFTAGTARVYAATKSLAIRTPGSPSAPRTYRR